MKCGIVIEPFEIKKSTRYYCMIDLNLQQDRESKTQQTTRVHPPPPPLSSSSLKHVHSAEALQPRACTCDESEEKRAYENDTHGHSP